MNLKNKVIVTVAPVCHVGKEVPAGSHNPLSPEDITRDVLACAKAGASQVHLHTRDLEGNPTFDLTVFQQTCDMIRSESDIIIQSSTGGLSSLSLEERCVCLNVPAVQVASLNMGSVNFAETVYVNTLPEIRYWKGRIDQAQAVPEMELFDLSHVETCTRLADEGVLQRPLHYNFCLGPGASSNLSATTKVIDCLLALTEEGSTWGLNHDTMPDLNFLITAVKMGANAIRVGFEDSFYYEKGKNAANNAELVERLVALLRENGYEPASVEEAKVMLGVRK